MRNLISAKLMTVYTRIRGRESLTPFPPRKDYNHVAEGVNLLSVRSLTHIVKTEARAIEQKIRPDYRSSIPRNFNYARVSS